MNAHVQPFTHSPLFQFAVVCAAGIVFATRIQIRLTYFIVGLLLTTVAAIFSARIGRGRVAGLMLLLAILFASSSLSTLQRRTRPDQLRNLIDSGLVDAESVVLTGVVTGPVEVTRDGIHFSLNADSINTTTQSINCSGVVALSAYFRGADDVARYRILQLQSGERISVMTKLDRTDEYRNPGVSTLSEYLETKGIDAIGVIRGPESIVRIANFKRASVSAVLYKWRAFLQQQFDSNFSGETAAVLSAALLGNRYNLSTAAAERFREGGTFHILVISGAHISFLGALVLLIARRLLARRWLQLAASASVVWLYTILVGAEVSVVRAAFMFTFVALGHLMFRTSLPLNSLGAAALVLLVWNPKDLFDPSLQLTFLSVWAIVALAWPILKNLQQIGAWRPSRTTPYPPNCSRLIKTLAESLFWSESDWLREQAKLNHTFGPFKSPLAGWLERHHLQRLLRYLFAAVLVSLAVQVALLPLQIVYFHRLSVSSLILNIVVGILLTVLAAVSLITLLVVGFSSTLAVPLTAMTNCINWLMLHSVDPFARFGVASIRVAEYSGRGSAIYILYYIPLIVFAFLLARCRLPGSRRGQQAGGPGNILVFLTTAQVLIVGLLLWHPLSVQSTQGRLRVDFLDVGQGDSALLTMPNGATLLIDGGGRPQFLVDSLASRGRSIGETVVCEYLWYRGLDEIDYVLATHADADHMQGLNDVVKHFKVRGALVARTPANDPAFAEFAQTLRTRATPIQMINAGDVLKFGEVEIDVLWPPLATEGAPSRNNDSVVLRVRYGQRKILLTGDIEKMAEQFVSTSDRVHADVVKVPHHGSRTSSTEAFVAAVQPRLAVISVGQKSMFGHPHPEVIERWKDAGAEVLTTGRSGMITVLTDGSSWGFEKFVK
ncbi:MAG TPA: DNA internalization-related competence protein ComEC/Rec2 [Pyrinomonadaceae bacterium]|nr:DNA internalization-related competence protein ComEC/Rec2 [Pyrinomonadaceae bacterium]